MPVDVRNAGVDPNIALHGTTRTSPQPRCGGETDSKHQLGRALDLVPGRLPPNKTHAEALNDILEAARTGILQHDSLHLQVN